MVMEVLSPVRAFTNVLQSDNNPTISLVLPGLLSLLAEFESSSNVYAREIVPVLKRRFQAVLSSGDADNEPAYLAASFLDPRTMRLEIMQDKLDRAKLVLKALVRKFHPQQAFGNTTGAVEKPSPFGFGKVRVVRPAVSADDLQLQKFFEEIEGEANFEDDPVQFWEARKLIYPAISHLAFDIMAVPASTAAVERMFSVMTMLSSGRKTRTGPSLLRSKTMLVYNAPLIDI
jgi:hypothetical protein